MISTVFHSEPPRLLDRIPRHLKGCQARLEESDAVAVKLHMGEEGNARYIRPAVVRAVADWLKTEGMEPFVTDSTSLYKRKRGTLFDYLRTAARHGFTSETMGCPVLIADGIKSKGIIVEVKAPLKLERVGVASLIYDADGLVSLSHVTLHPDVIPAGSLKNVAMGCTDKEAKMRMHASDAKPAFNLRKCTGCGTCVRHCPSGALALEAGKAKFDPDKCVSCAECIALCNYGAVKVNWSALSRDVCGGAVDGASAVLSTFKPRRCIFMNLGYDVTEECDCAAGSDLPVVADFGLLTSLDPVAVDQASADMINASPVYPGGPFGRLGSQGDRLSIIKPGVDWRGFLDLAASSNLGTTSYRIKSI